MILDVQEGRAIFKDIITEKDCCLKIRLTGNQHFMYYRNSMNDHRDGSVIEKGKLR